MMRTSTSNKTTIPSINNCLDLWLTSLIAHPLYVRSQNNIILLKLNEELMSWTEKPCRILRLLMWFILIIHGQIEG